MSKIRLRQETLDKWKNMTNGKEYIEVRIDIAKRMHLDKITEGDFAGMDFVRALETAKYLREVTHRYNLTMECIVTCAMRQEIVRMYGEEIAQKVWECL